MKSRLLGALITLVFGTTCVQASYISEVLSDNPLGYYQLNETSGTTAIDSSGNGQDGTYIGGKKGVKSSLYTTPNSSSLMLATFAARAASASFGASRWIAMATVV